MVVDGRILERNLQAMASASAAAGLALRPHAKTHKCFEIGRRQLALGAAGLSVATLGEAEAFADAGADDLFVAYPIWARGDGNRIRNLVRRVHLSVGADSLVGVERLAEALGPDRHQLDVLVEVDCGLRRSGVPAEDAGRLGRSVIEHGLRFAGIFTYPGHSYRPGGAAAARIDEARSLEAAVSSLAEAGVACPIRSGGSTPTAKASATLDRTDPLTELRPGVYVFNDAQQVELGTCAMEDVALGVRASVVSLPGRGRVVLDAGSKVLGSDRPAWMPGYGLVLERPDWRITGLWEHHAVVDTPEFEGDAPVRHGDVFTVVPNHVCTTVNLADTLQIVEDQRLVVSWAVAARGRNH